MNEKLGDDEFAVNQDDAMVRRAAQRYGTVGAMLAGGMLVFDKLLGRKPKEEAAVVIEAASEQEILMTTASRLWSMPTQRSFHPHHTCVGTTPTPVGA